jgi:hypothetical protein
MKRVRLAVAIALLVVLAACGPKTAGSPSPLPSASHEPLVIASMPLKAGEVGLAYSGATFDATGGVQPYTFQITEGALPAGLTLSRDGVLTGSPTPAGDFSFTFEVVDSGGQATSAQDSIDVVPALKLTALKSGAIYVESGCDTVCGGFATQSGGQAPYKYSLKSGALPRGTSLGGTALAGMFTSPGTYNFTIDVTDALGADASVAATFSVLQHIYFYCPSPWPAPGGGCTPSGYNGTLSFQCTQVGDHPDCTGSLMYAGGSSGGWAVTYRVVAGDQPPAGSGFGVPVNGSVPPVTIIGVTILQPPTPGATASGTLLVTLSDSMVCGPGGAHCSTSAYLGPWSVQHRTPY